MKKVIAYLTVMCAIVCQVSVAQSKSGTADPSVTDFVTNATVANMKEIVTGKMAGKKAQNAEVKRYGDQMVEHHKMATKEMMTVVKTKGYKIPKPPVEAAAPDSMLVNATGAEFDRMYMTMMVADHQKTIQLFETASTSVSDPDLKAFAVKTLPLLRQHLTEAQAIVSKLGTSSSAVNQ
jgi:putative membrane protein